MEKTDVFSLDGEYIASTYARFGVNIVSGKGSILKGGDGKEYIDLGAGIATNVFGACDDVWIKAVTDQLTKIQHASNLYYTDPGPRLARLLCGAPHGEVRGAKDVQFVNLRRACARDGPSAAGRRLYGFRETRALRV